MMLPPFTGNWPITAGWRYSSGTGHFAYDYGCPTGTPLYAVGDGVILAANDGVPNDRPGSPDYTGEASNWILLGTHYKGRKVSVLYQHMSPGHKKREGQKIRVGQLLGESGDSGNTSGPHLHLAAMYGWWGEASRYIYMTNDGDNNIVLFPPDELWKDNDDMPLTEREIDDIAERAVDKMMNRKVFGPDAPKDLQDVTVRKVLRRTYLGHDEPSEV